MVDTVSPKELQINKSNTADTEATFVDMNYPLHVRKHTCLNILKNLPPQNEHFQIKNSDIFHISAQNLDCWYSLEPLHRGGSNKYSQSMFLSRNKKTNVYHVNPNFTIQKWDLRGTNYMGMFS